ncbi:MAG: NADH-quinone oxidoreductase subunit NuoF [Thermodesulfobacteriota bacterium]|nr:NADH-quinone oxidoreductase subunit NuoF [Thermodesulfobacteriota bacterium]
MRSTSPKSRPGSSTKSSRSFHRTKEETMAQVSTAEERGKRLESVEELEIFREQLLSERDPDRPCIIVCHGTGCRANGSPKVADALTAAIRAAKLDTAVIPQIKATGCHGFCSCGPLVIMEPSGIFYQQVKPGDAEEIVQTTLVEGKPVERLLYKDPKTGEPIAYHEDIPFYKYQERIVMRHIGHIDPRDLKDSIAAGAYKGLAKVLTSMTPEQVVSEVEISGLRGRGGAGFPTGRKWQTAIRAAQRKNKPLYVVVNGDEGDPGAFMDRTLMEGDPHAVIEGLIIGAYAMGSHQGFMYVRAEYPLAIEHLNIAMEQARELGLLGEHILGSGFSFDVQINRGAGAFVCGESTALFTSIEGRAGEPKPKYVRSAEEGLWGNPTVLNNVETWCNVPIIIQNGADWYSGLGVSHSTGTKVFSLVGKVNNVGLVEVPMGMPLEDLIEKIGGGVPGQDHFKAVQTGGPSGGCIPHDLAKTPVDFDSLTKAGSMMGSGGMIVMDERDCVVDVARYFLRFLEDESCGKCLPCRLGLKSMLQFLDAFARGEGSIDDIKDLESLAKAVQDGALCALGGSAPNPVLTTLRYFRDEYEAHIRDHKCPAGVCRELITYRIDPDACTGCGTCARSCPQQCITGEKKLHTIDEAQCIRCGICMESCKFAAVVVE